jgi:hypothetical protein
MEGKAKALRDAPHKELPHNKIKANLKGLPYIICINSLKIAQE